MKILEDITSYEEDETIVDEASENITSEKKEEETLDNSILQEEEGTVLDYDDEDDQYKSYTPYISDEEEIYEAVQIGGGGGSG
uniref:Uncharacterized protein n=1 Tax=Romanomermis culicivorax TaxID=13658 RepID=A0A915J989_ROMCU